MTQLASQLQLHHEPKAPALFYPTTRNAFPPAEAPRQDLPVSPRPPLSGRRPTRRSVANATCASESAIGELQAAPSTSMELLNTVSQSRIQRGSGGRAQTLPQSAASPPSAVKPIRRGSTRTTVPLSSLNPTMGNDDAHQPAQRRVQHGRRMQRHHSADEVQVLFGPSMPAVTRETPFSMPGEVTTSAQRARARGSQTARVGTPATLPFPGAVTSLTPRAHPPSGEHHSPRRRVFKTPTFQCEPALMEEPLGGETFLETAESPLTKEECPMAPAAGPDLVQQQLQQQLLQQAWSVKKRRDDLFKKKLFEARKQEVDKIRNEQEAHRTLQVDIPSVVGSCSFWSRWSRVWSRWSKRV